MSIVDNIKGYENRTRELYYSQERGTKALQGQMRLIIR